MFRGPVRQAVRPPGSRHGPRAAPAGRPGASSQAGALARMFADCPAQGPPRTWG